MHRQYASYWNAILLYCAIQDTVQSRIPCLIYHYQTTTVHLFISKTKLNMHFFLDQQTAIDDLYVTENLQNQGLIDLHESLAQVETEIANVDADLTTLQSNLNGEYQYRS